MNRSLSHTARPTEHGFTLVELLVVLIILGLLLMLGAPYFVHEQQQTQDNQTKRQLAVSFDVLKRISLEEDTLPSTPVLVERLKHNLPGLDFVSGLPLKNQWTGSEIGVESDGNNQAVICMRSPSGNVFTVRVVLPDPNRDATGNANVGVYYGSGNGCTDNTHPATPGIPPVGNPPQKGENEHQDTEWIGNDTNPAPQTYQQPPTLVINKVTDYPSNPPSVSGNPGDAGGGTLTVDEGTWDPRWPVVSYDYKWVRCDNTVPQSPAPAAPSLPENDPSCVVISGATGKSYTTTAADEDHYLYVQVTAHTQEGMTATVVSDPFRCANPPANTVLPSISDLRGAWPPRDEDMLQGNNGTWTGTLPFVWAYQWFRCDAAGANCVAITGATASTYRLSWQDIGSTIRFQATATNAKWADMTQTVISNQTQTVVTNPPQAPVDGSADSPQLTDTHNVAVVDTSVPHAVDDTFSGTNGNWGVANNGGGVNGGGGTDYAGDPLTYTYQWQRCTAANAATCTNIPGASSSSYTPTTADIGNYDRLCVTAHNSAGQATSCSDFIGPIVDKPRNAGGGALPSLPVAAPEWGSAFTISSVGTWTGTPTITYTYQWELCDAAGNNCNPIAGATSSSYTPGNADVGGTLRVIVTGTNTYGSNSATSAQSAVVQPAPPTNTVAPTISGASTVAGQTLSVGSNGSWSPNGAAITGYTYQWLHCNPSCAAIAGATGSSYTIATAYTGQTIELEVFATNGSSYGPGSGYSAQTATVTGYTPVVSTCGYSYSAGQTSARVYGCINDSGAASSSWQLNASDGQSTSGTAGTGGGPYPLDLSGLAYNTTYSWWICAQNPWASACSSSGSFTTSPPPDCDGDTDYSTCGTNPSISYSSPAYDEGGEPGQCGGAYDGDDASSIPYGVDIGCLNNVPAYFEPHSGCGDPGGDGAGCFTVGYSSKDGDGDNGPFACFLNGWAVGPGTYAQWQPAHYVCTDAYGYSNDSGYTSGSGG